ncbi:hypothetical protein [Klebsiella pneumoniae]|uniref:hypothetical protein n=1 Tax=Klebsiella pneumoniae TaxID=573 RepID=UPI001F0656DF|nr:hypothetical protein [Klebsiella pneumoniae]MCH0743487.1 hypothetical protein [Klebsiella pneumoniae]HBQ6066071.1 hypothetical protein [Klebsiella pneumoniae subsp. pneumoniae]HBW4351367.1 hypothetical protein [Klebsiella pneumoniae]
MTTNITELAQSLKAAADREMICRDGAETSEIWERTVTPENILALVEALEKAQSKLDRIKSTSCHVDTSEGAFIPNSLDAWGRPVPQYLPYDFSGNPGASAAQYCNGWNDAGGYWLNYVLELESRTVPVKLPNQTEFDDPLSAYQAIEKCKDALAAAGIKVEAE